MSNTTVDDVLAFMDITGYADEHSWKESVNTDELVTV